jgi:hypothetical protein
VRPHPKLVTPDGCSLAHPWSGLLAIHQLTKDTTPGTLHDQDGTALHRLGLEPHHAAHYLIRPDGHIGYCADGTALAGLDHYLDQFLVPASADRG